MSTALAIILFFLIIDTGGWLGSRIIATPALFFVLIWYGLVNKKLFLSPVAILLSLALLLSVLPSILQPYGDQFDFSLAISQTSPIFVYPLLLLVLSFIPQNNAFLIIKVITFLLASIIIIVSMSTALKLPGSSGIYQFLQAKPDAGYFSYKTNLFLLTLPSAYFKPTLLLVPMGVLCYNLGNKNLFFLCVLALFLAPSRTGFITMVAYYFWILGRNRSILTQIVLFLGLFFTALQFVSLSIFESGISVRTLHLLSYLELLEADWPALIFGFGPGTVFYSMGFRELTAGTEISQVEHFRRYGLIGTLTLIGVWFHLAKRVKKVRSAVILFWLVALSNPVLTTFPAFVFGALLLRLPRSNNLADKSNAR